MDLTSDVIEIRERGLPRLTATVLDDPDAIRTVGRRSLFVRCGNRTDPDAEPGSSTGDGLAVEVMAERNAVGVHQVETQPDAVRPRIDLAVCVEDVAAVVRRDAHSAVDDVDEQKSASAPAPDDHASAAGILQAVRHEIPEGADEQFRVGRDDRRTVDEAQPEASIGSGRSELGRDLGKQTSHPDGLQFRARAIVPRPAGSVGEILQSVGQSRDLMAGGIQPHPVGVVARQLAEPLNGPQDDLERLSEIVAGRRHRQSKVLRQHGAVLSSARSWRPRMAGGRSRLESEDGAHVRHSR